jgi:hypothetical protein
MATRRTGRRLFEMATGFKFGLRVCDFNFVVEKMKITLGRLEIEVLVVKYINEVLKNTNFKAYLSQTSLRSISNSVESELIEKKQCRTKPNHK